MFPISYEVKYDTSALKQASHRIGVFCIKLRDELAKQIQDTVKLNIIDRDLIDTGYLLSSVEIQEFEGFVVVYVGAYYGGYHEYGTIHFPARPFFFPAVDEVMTHIAFISNKIFEQGLIQR